MSAPAIPLTPAQNRAVGAAWLRANVLNVVPDITWAELAQVMSSKRKMSGWLSRLGHDINTGIRAVGDATGLGDVTTAVTNIDDTVGHTVEDASTGNFSKAFDDLLENIGITVNSGANSGAVAPASSPKKWIIIAAVGLVAFYFLSRKK